MSNKNLLKELLSLFYLDTEGHLEWPWVDGITVGDKLGTETEEELKKILNEE